MKFVSFDKVVRDICNLMGDPAAQRHYLTVAKTLKTVLDQLDLHVFPSVKTIPVTINDNLTIDLPADIAAVNKVGTLTSRGTLKVFGLDPGLIQPIEEIECGCTEVDNTSDTSTVTTCPACTFHGCFWDGHNYGELYGYRRPQFANGRWKPDYINNRIILGSGTDVEAGGTVLIEYKADMEADNKFIQIPADAFTMLMYRVFQLTYSHQSPGKAAEYARFFKKEYDTFKQMNSDISIKDVIAAFRGSKMSAIKR